MVKDLEYYKEKLYGPDRFERGEHREIIENVTSQLMREKGHSYSFAKTLAYRKMDKISERRMLLRNKIHIDKERHNSELKRLLPFIKELKVSTKVNQKNLLNNFKKIAKEYGYKVVINPKSSWWLMNKYDKVIKVPSGDLELKSSIKSFCHEIAHCVQYLVDPDLDVRYDFDLRLFFERAADRLAYFIYKKYFKDIVKIHHASFNTYKKMEFVMYLREHHDRIRYSLD